MMYCKLLEDDEDPTAIQYMYMFVQIYNHRHLINKVAAKHLLHY